MKTLDKQNIWMITNWEKLRRLENAMNQARGNCTKLIGQIHASVKRRFPALDRNETYFSPNEIRDYGGQAAFSSGKWPYKYPKWRTGIYVSGISLDALTEEKQIEPAIFIWVGVGENKRDERVEVLRARITQKAKKIFANKNLQWKSNDDDWRVCLIYPLLEERSKLIELLVKSEGKGFVDCMVNHINRMAAFIPIMDEVLTK